MATKTSTSDLKDESIAAWTTNATYWDEGIGAGGNVYWKRLQEPSLARLIVGDPHAAATARQPGFRALDLCTGNGLGARWLVSRAGASSVVATDGSAEMLDKARARGQDGGGAHGDGRIQYRLLDVCDRGDLEREAAAAGEFGGYDVVLMNMAIMDVPELDVLAMALPKLLSKDGVFVATLLHPVFFTSNAARNVQLRFNEATGELEVVRTKVVRDYLFIPPVLGHALPGQPAKQPYFHRPFHELFRPFFAAGLVMDAIEEPAFTEADGDPRRIEASVNYTQLPAILSFRMKRGFLS